jgi:hypothetical protein
MEPLTHFCLTDCSLDVSTSTEGSATGHLDTGFLHFPVFEANPEIVPKFSVATA